MIKTKQTCRFGESGFGRTSGGWKFPEPITLRSFSSGNFQPPSVRPIPDSPSCNYVCYRTKGSGFRTTVNRNIFVPDLCCPFAHAATNPIANHLNFEPCPKTFNRESRHFLSGDIWISDNSFCKRLPQSYCLSFLSICYMYCISRESSLYSNPTAEIIQIFCLLYIQCPRACLRRPVFTLLCSHCYACIGYMHVEGQVQSRIKEPQNKKGILGLNGEELNYL